MKRRLAAAPSVSCGFDIYSLLGGDPRKEGQTQGQCLRYRFLEFSNRRASLNSEGHAFRCGLLWLYT